MNSEKILNNPVGSVLYTLAVPVILSNLLHSLYDLTDTFFVSMLGTRYLAAMNLIWPILFLSIALASGLSVGGTALISQAVGAKQNDLAKRYAGMLMLCATVLSVVIGVLGYGLSGTIAGWMGAEGELRALSAQYLSISFIGLPSVFLFFAYSSIRQAQGDTRSPMKLTLVSVLINIALDPIFIFVFHWGIAGAALATVLARLVVLGYALPKMMQGNDGITLTMKDFIWHRESAVQLIKTSFPAALGQFMASFGFAILNTFIIDYGEATMSAFAIGNRISALSFMPAQGYGTALVTVVGQALGAGDVKRVKKAFWSATLWSSVFLIGLALPLYFGAEIVISWFSKDPEVVSPAILYLRMILITIPIFGTFQTLIGFFQGTGHTTYAMMMTMGRLWVLRIPMVVAAMAFTNMGEEVIWYAMVLSNALISLFGFALYYRGKWAVAIVKAT